MISVAITGNISSGKSTVLNFLKNKGYKVFSSDEYVNELYKDPKVIEQVESILSIKEPSKECIAEIIFNDLNKKNQIEELIHPLVLSKIHTFIKSSKSICFIEVPLLFELGWEKFFSYVITIWCSEEKRLARTRFKKEKLEEILKHQLKIEEKIKKSHFVIDNDRELEYTLLQTENILKILCAK